MPELHAENLVKRYKSRTVVSGASLGVGKGEVVGLLGPNGAGGYRARLFNPRTGAVKPIRDKHELNDAFVWTPPSPEDWVLHLVNTALNLMKISP